MKHVRVIFYSCAARVGKKYINCVLPASKFVFQIPSKCLQVGDINNVFSEWRPTGRHVRLATVIPDGVRRIRTKRRQEVKLRHRNVRVTRVTPCVYRTVLMPSVRIFKATFVKWRWK